MATSIHKRSYDCEAFAEDENLMRVRGHLTDDKPQGLGLADGESLVIHEMTVDLMVKMPEFEIVGVETDMLVRPYEMCTHVLPDYQQLVGLSITRGYAKKVRELFGGPGGCSHMGALLVAMGPVAIQASWSFATLHEDPADGVKGDPDPDALERRLQMNANTCHVWVEDGPQMTAVQMGTDPLRPEWETERLQKLGVLGT
ncbi:MAG: hypothetical protein ACI8TP_001178 [Acidimicrobiales bacterium]|jgi:hypothetical protein